MLSHDGTTELTTLTWSAPDDLGGLSVVYDTLSSTVPNDFVTGVVCVESNDGADTQAVDAGTPPSGVTNYYLVRAQNDCPDGLGSVGLDEDGQVRIASDCP